MEFVFKADMVIDGISPDKAEEFQDGLMDAILEYVVSQGATCGGSISLKPYEGEEEDAAEADDIFRACAIIGHGDDDVNDGEQDRFSIGLSVWGENPWDRAFPKQALAAPVNLNLDAFLCLELRDLLVNLALEQEGIGPNDGKLTIIPMKACRIQFPSGLPAGE